jgi:hypothetical protein
LTTRCGRLSSFRLANEQSTARPAEREALAPTAACGSRQLLLVAQGAERLKHAQRQAEALQELAWPAVAARFAELLAQIPHQDRSEAR